VKHDVLSGEQTQKGDVAKERNGIRMSKRRNKDYERPSLLRHLQHQWHPWTRRPSKKLLSLCYFKRAGSWLRRIHRRLNVSAQSLHTGNRIFLPPKVQRRTATKLLSSPIIAHGLLTAARRFTKARRYHPHLRMPTLEVAALTVLPPFAVTVPTLHHVLDIDPIPFGTTSAAVR
jgi:hypothetical protein